MLGSRILYLKGMRTTMFQLSGFYCNGFGLKVVLRRSDKHRSQSQLAKPLVLAHMESWGIISQSQSGLLKLVPHRPGY